jgi:tetratricopeptide (TPR) repeat protein
MTNDDLLTKAIQLIKAGETEAARAILEPFLVKNPNHIQAWMWEAELFARDRDKIRVLEACLKFNPGQPQVTKALTFLKGRSASSDRPSVPVPGSQVFSAPPPDKFTPPVYPYPDVYDSYEKFDPVPEAPKPSLDFLYKESYTESPVTPLPPAASKTGPKTKSKPRNPMLMNAIIVVAACIAVTAAAGMYLGGGSYLSSQIVQSFAQQDCTVVVGYSAFVSLYPEGIFGTMFAGHDQYDECRLKVAAEHALAAKNWEVVVSSAREYLDAYPQGVFAGSMREQAPQCLWSWSQELIENGDYGNGIEKLVQLAEGYPDSPPAQTARDTIQQTYVLWITDLIGTQNFTGAEQHSLAALSYFETDPARAEPIKQILIQVYIDWGNSQVQLGDLENGILHYQKAEGISPDTVDVDLLIAQAKFQAALAVADTGNYEMALTRIREVTDAAPADNVKAEAEAALVTVLTSYSMSTSVQAMDRMSAAITQTCQGQRPELPLFGRDPEKVRFGLTDFRAVLPPEWAAERPAEMHYVICIEESADELETCRYTGNNFLIRMRYVWKVSLYKMLDGTRHSTRTLRGTSPDQCPPRAVLQVNSNTHRSYGGRPSVDAILDWLETLDLGN